jgi:hypothetical protein
MHGLPLLAPHYQETFLSSIVQTPRRDRWAHLRFSIIGTLLAAPPAPGRLMASLQALAAKPWRHPDTGLDVRFSAATLERWFYTARRGTDPVAVLRNRKRDNAGQFSCMSAQLIEALTTQYREHPGWTMQLHFDNLLSKFKGSDMAVTSYPTIRRYLKAHGMFRKAAPKRATAGALAARVCGWSRGQWIRVRLLHIGRRKQWAGGSFPLTNMLWLPSKKKSFRRLGYGNGSVQRGLTDKK